MSTTTAARRPYGDFDRRRGSDRAEEAYRRFAELTQRVGPEQWSNPTDCALWTVRDLVGHVVGAMRAAASVRELLSQQREIKRRLAADDGVITDVMTQVQVDRTADLSVDQLVSECRALVVPAAAGRRRTPAPLRRLVRFPVEMEGIDETWTLGYLLDVVLTRDAWLHKIDLARALGLDPQVTADHDGPIVADVVREWADRHGQDYDLILTGAAGGHFRAGRGADPVEMDAVEFCRVLSGREAGVELMATPVPF